MFENTPIFYGEIIHFDEHIFGDELVEKPPTIPVITGNRSSLENMENSKTEFSSAMTPGAARQ